MDFRLNPIDENNARVLLDIPDGPLPESLMNICERFCRLRCRLVAAPMGLDMLLHWIMVLGLDGKPAIKPNTDLREFVGEYEKQDQVQVMDDGVLKLGRIHSKRGAKYAVTVVGDEKPFRFFDAKDIQPLQPA